MAPKDENYIELAHQRADEKKTHVSFPQLKYPSLRDEGFRHPVQWLMGKALDDGADGLWRVHDGIYDLSAFINKHPGGGEWLELSKGTDITEAFESHHLNPAVDKMLEKYYVRDATTPRNSPFTFKEDGFYKTLKRAIREELKNVPANVPRHTDMFMNAFLLTLLVSSVVGLWLEDYWYKMISYIVSTLCLNWVVCLSHNYIHRRTNWRMYLFNMSLWSYRDFRVSHALSHHPYPNTLMDLEVSAFEPYILWNPRKKPLRAYLSFAIEMVSFPFMFIVNFLKRFMLNFTQKGFFKEHYRWHDGIGFLLPLWMWLASGATFYDAVISWLWILCSASFLFMNIASNAAHHHPKIFKDGDQIPEPNPDWGMHEMEAVMDRKDVNGNIFMVVILFGYHALHHLFPTLDHGVLGHLYPVFTETCEKFRANFRMTSSLDLFLGQIKMTVKTNPALMEERK